MWTFLDLLRILYAYLPCSLLHTTTIAWVVCQLWLRKREMYRPNYGSIATRTRRNVISFSHNFQSPRTHTESVSLLIYKIGSIFISGTPENFSEYGARNRRLGVSAKKTHVNVSIGRDPWSLGDCHETFFARMPTRLYLWLRTDVTMPQTGHFDALSPPTALLFCLFFCS